MKKTTNKTTEEKTLLKPFPFIENEKYLLKLKNGNYIVAYWWSGQFALDFNGDCIEEEIESYISMKDLGL